MDDVTVSVLTPVLDEARHLREAVARMLDQDIGEPFELLLIDGGSTDGTPAILAELAAADPRVRVLDNPRRRTPFALNVGLAAARGEFICRMDAHSHYPPEYLRLGVQRLREGGVTHVSGPQIAVGDGVWSRRIALALSTPLGTGGAAFRRDQGLTEWEVDTGFTGMWRRDVLVEAGGWAEAWLTDQDCELAFRLAEHGGRHVCVRGMAASYIPRGTLRALSRQYWEYGQHKVMTFRRHPAAMRPSHLLPLLVVATTASSVAAPTRGLRRLARVGLGIYAGALTTGVVSAETDSRADRLSLPLVEATMHLSYGLGQLHGVGRYGFPGPAVRQAAGRLLRRVAR